MSQEKCSRQIPERLRKRLIGELILFFDKDFPITMCRIGEVDEKMSRIVSDVIFLMENIMQLPERVREPVFDVVTGGKRDLQEKLLRLYEEGSEHFWEWLDTAFTIAQRRVEKFHRTFEEDTRDLR